MLRINSPKTYALVTGLVLFCLGLFGFAFRSSFNIPDSYLVISLILGFWGLVVAANFKN